MKEGTQNAALLWREITLKGFRGSASRVRQFVATRRTVPPSRGPGVQKWKPGRSSSRSPLGYLPSPRQCAFLLAKDESQLETPPIRFRSALLQTLPQLAQATHLANEFKELLLKGQLLQFQKWLVKVNQSGLAELTRFAKGLCRDRDAVEAAIRFPWSNGQLEGQINKLKAIQRQMYGRAKPDLLKIRMLCW